MHPRSPENKATKEVRRAPGLVKIDAVIFDDSTSSKYQPRTTKQSNTNLEEETSTLEAPILQTFVHFTTGRCHATFSDNSSLIFHPGMKTLSYYSPNGILSRYLSDSLPSHSHIARKYVSGSKMYNYSQRGDTYVQSLPEAEEDTLITDLGKVSARWPRSNSATCDANKVREVGPKVFQITSLEGDCTVTLLKCLWVVEVEFYRSLATTNGAAGDSAVVFKKKDLDIDYRSMKITDILKSGLKNKVGKQANDNADNSEVVLGYRYVKQKRKFHLANVPVKYSFPVYLLLKERQRVYQEENDIIGEVVLQLFTPRFREIIGRIEVYGENTEENDQYLRREYSISYLEGFFLMPLNKFSHTEGTNSTSSPKTSPEPPLSRLAQISLTFPSDSLRNKPKSSGTRAAGQSPNPDGPVWEQDERNPTDDPFLISHCVFYLYHKSTEAFFDPRPSAQCPSVSLLLATGSYFYSLADRPSMYTFVSTDNGIEGSEDGLNVRVINVQCPPKKIRTVTPDGQIVREEEVKDTLLSVENINRLNRINYGLQNNDPAASNCLGAPREQNKQSANSSPLMLGRGKNRDKEVDKNDPLDTVACCSSDRAVCEAFRNGMVKLKFTDRTILNYDPKSAYFSVLSRFGEQNSILVSKPGPFIEYLRDAIDFQDYIFGDPREREAKIRNKENLQRLIEEELQRSAAMRKIIRGDPLGDDFLPNKERASEAFSRDSWNVSMSSSDLYSAGWRSPHK
jgi:hypothetical protein